MSDTPAHGDAEPTDELTLTSPAFDDGESIPEQYSRDGADVNPPLSIEGVPEDAVSLALVVDDPDARDPAGKVWVHWLVWNIGERSSPGPASQARQDVDPNRDSIPEDWDVEGSTEGASDFGETGYGGPSPPDGEHTYRFKLYALDEELGLTPGATKDELGASMEGSVLAQTQLTGTFAPDRG